MAHVYVDSNATGGGTGADWANAYTTLAAALTAKAAGDNFWVAHNHAESAASAKTLTSPGTAAAPCTVICVNSAGTVPPVSADLRTTATITTTGANAIVFGGGYVYYYGITFNCGSGAVTTGFSWSNASQDTRFHSCQLAKLGTSASTTAINFGPGSGYSSTICLDNTTVRFGNTGDGIGIKSTRFHWRNTASAVSASGSTPTILFRGGQAISCEDFLCEGVDFSLITGTLVAATLAGPATLRFASCKLGSAVTVKATGSAGLGDDEVLLINCDSGATNYRHEKYNYAGTQTVETTIVRTGGATDGTTPISWKIVTTANSKWIAPFESIPIAIWNSTTGANRTVTVYGYWDSAAVPKNDDIWIKVSYMGSSATPIATINEANGKADYLATGADQGTDSSTWGGGDTTTRFAMSVTLSSPQPALAGPIYVTVKAAKASSTFYVDPKIVLS